MSSENDRNKSGSTDRMLRLLWRKQLGAEEGTRGPRKKLSLDQILAAAIELADEEGLAAFSMRKVADRVGISVMSLYTYVPGRSELLGLMVDEVVGRTELPEHAGSWRERLRAVSGILWHEYHRHPWLLDAHSHRPWIGPHISARYEWELQAVDGCGLDDVSMDHTITLIESHTAASAANSIKAQQLVGSSGITDMEWWEINAPILEQVMPADEFAVSSRVGSAVGHQYQAVTSHEAVYEFGLDVILDGIEARIGAGSEAGQRRGPV
jgi:AcrR family transcriptional regulator